jgi:hypothetical protein
MRYSMRSFLKSLSPLTMAALMCASVAAQESETQSAATQQITPGVAVDAARKSSDNPPYISEETGEGVTFGGYQTKQTAEFGGRISGFSGNQGVWDTFVNLGSGPRLLEYTLDMHSPNHTGAMFDDLTFSNFGYGGDPIDVSRLRVMKGSVYNFNASFRRDQNIFDFNLLANPLNPTNSNPFIPIQDSPHEFLMTRRMSDLNLSLLPQSVVRFRLGWSRVVNEGTEFSSIHQGTEALLSQPTLNTSDNYQAGVSLRFIPRTSIDYDQYYTYFKGDNSSTLDSLPFVLPGGAATNLGISWNTPARQPCSAPFLGALANPTCNQFTGQFFQNRTRISYPTEQISFQSSYFKRLDMSGRFTYSSADSNLPMYLEAFSGFDSRVQRVADAITGSANARRITRTGDFGLTYRITDKMRVVDSFRASNFGIPTAWSISTLTAFGPNAITPTVAGHVAGSGPDASQDFFNQFLRQDDKLNTIQLEYDFTRKTNGYIGYRYERREITLNDATTTLETFLSPLPNRGDCAGLPVVNGACTTTVTDSGSEFTPINAHSALLGFSTHPMDRLRASFDSEFYWADNTFTRIAPRHMQIYRVRANYRATDWINLGTAINIRENRNTTSDIGNFQHNRSFAFTAALAPAESKWGFDLSYDYNDIFSQTNICFVATPVPATALSCGTPFLSGISLYNQLAHYAAGSLYLKPFSKVTAAVGYTITSTSGDTLILNPNAPLGPLNYNYHLPMATLAIDLAKNLTYKTGWNYYDYNEKAAPGPLLPRDFRGNVFTLSVRYSR